MNCGCESTSVRIFVCDRPPGYSPECVNYLADMIKCLIANQHKSLQITLLVMPYLISPNDRIHHPFLVLVVQADLV